MMGKSGSWIIGRRVDEKRPLRLCAVPGRSLVGLPILRRVPLRAAVMGIERCETLFPSYNRRSGS